MEGLLAAGIGRPDGAEAGGGIGGVDPVDEDQAGVADGPGRFDDELEDLAGVLLAGRRAGVGVDDVVVGAGRERGHEGVGDGDRDVEVRDRRPVELHLDEFLDVGVVDAEDAHVGAAARAALLDGLGGGVDDLEKGDRAGGDALGLADEAALGPQEAEVEARPAALLVDEGGVLDRVEDRVERVLDGQDETGGQAHAPAGPGQGGAVGQEVAGVHGLEEELGVLLAVGLGLLGGGDVGRDAAEEVFGGLVEEIALLVLQEVAGLQDLQGVVGKTAGRGHGDLQVSTNSHPRKLNPSGILRITNLIRGHNTCSPIYLMGDMMPISNLLVS